ncbi:hypothetical protein TI39_contig4192g00001 [Zymoseptoria brevis]|uniref:PA14 domain-containing protein n=1 Tax=Zymoseptoria brevis TaxID=1047168 RepID=A0A0F4GAQ0_9PEZI|nr:hypothetical protein TI39_contig4192g00001 [Zymoseptoria brevis]
MGVGYQELAQYPPAHGECQPTPAPYHAKRNAAPEAEPIPQLYQAGCSRTWESIKETPAAASTVCSCIQPMEHVEQCSDCEEDCSTDRVQDHQLHNYHKEDHDSSGVHHEVYHPIHHATLQKRPQRPLAIPPILLPTLRPQPARYPTLIRQQRKFSTFHRPVYHSVFHAFRNHLIIYDNGRGNQLINHCNGVDRQKGQPNTSGSTTDLGPFTDGNIYGVKHTGYIFARVTGDYVYNLGKPDDVAYLWVNEDVGFTYTGDNADMVSSYQDASTKTYAVSLTCGAYYPFRIWYRAYDYPNTFFSASITDSEGNALMSDTSGASDVVLRYSCDRTTAPQIFNWGGNACNVFSLLGRYPSPW